MKIVKVGRVGQRMIEMAANDDATVATILTTAGLVKLVNEDIWDGHIKISFASQYVPSNGAHIFLEQRKLDTNLINLIENIDMYDLDFGGYENAEEIYEDFKEEIDAIVRLAKLCK